jgi:hypothetical protein
MATTKTEEKKENLTEEKKVTIRLPLTRKEKNDVYVAVNGHPYLIKRGVDVEVPESVAEVLKHKEEMLDLAMEYEAQAAANADQ